MGKKLPVYFLREYLYWYCVFAFMRLIFMIANTDEIFKLPLLETLSTFYHALYLDTSMASYLVAITFLLFTCASIFERKIFITINKYYVITITAILISVCLSELEIYNEFGTKIGFRHVQHIVDVSEVVRSASTWFLIIGTILIIALVWGWFLIYKKIGLTKLPTDKRNWLTIVSFFLITPFIIALGIRGGTQQIPIQSAEAYFSKHNVLNLASVNTGWNLVHSIIENHNVLKGNPYQYYSLDEAQNNVKKIYAVEKDSTTRVLTTTRPNVMLIIVESLSADMLKSLGGYDSVMPNLENIIREGILFENCYASGSLSDQGMAAVLSAFPSQPATSIISQPSKYTHLPCITNEMSKVGYSTSFIFGGQLSYGNIKAFIYYNQFDRIIEDKDFDPKIKRGKLGVHDEHSYARQLEELKTLKQPFFSALFTTSTHSPYDYPGNENKSIAWGGDEHKYVNAVHYADKQLMKFLEQAQKTDWYKNTLFVLIADHSHRTPKHYGNNQPEYRKIPFVLWGDVIKQEFRGYKSKKIISQVDLASTLLRQMDLHDDKFMWSKNAFNPYTPEFAYYETTDGFGWIRNDGYIVYSHSSQTFYYEQVKNTIHKKQLEMEGKSFLQSMFQQYTDF